MSRMPYLIDAEDARWGHKMGHFPLVDGMYRDGFRCSLSGLIMGETVELLAREYGISREESDRYAVESQRRVEEATSAGRFAAEIALMQVPGPKGETTIAADEQPRPGTTLEALAQLPIVFPDVEGLPGIITAGSSSGITDGGAAVIVAGGDTVREQGLFSGGPLRVSTPRAWASARCPRCASCWPACSSPSTTSIWSS
jgi:acetyl-CoA C-acetyltransferase